MMLLVTSSSRAVLMCAMVLLVVAPTSIAQNLVVTSTDVAVVTPSLNSKLLPAGPLQNNNPADSIDDVAVDRATDRIFAISFSSRSITSWTVNTTDGTLSLVDAKSFGSDVSLSPFSGISASSGTLILSGGTGGFTVWQYNVTSGVLDETPIAMNQDPGNVVGHPDVLMLDQDTAALSTDFPSGFGTLIVDLSTLQPLRDFRVQNTLGFDLLAGAANFPLVNCLYTSGDKQYMYTANGALTVQDPFQDGVLNELDLEVRAFSCDAHPGLGLLVVAGERRSSPGEFSILVYDIRDDPEAPVLVRSRVDLGDERVTQVAFFRGDDEDDVVYTTTNGDIKIVSFGDDGSNVISDSNSSGADTRLSFKSVGTLFGVTVSLLISASL